MISQNSLKFKVALIAYFLPSFEVFAAPTLRNSILDDVKSAIGVMTPTLGNSILDDVKSAFGVMTPTLRNSILDDVKSAFGVMTPTLRNSILDDVRSAFGVMTPTLRNSILDDVKSAFDVHNDISASFELQDIIFLYLYLFSLNMSVAVRSLQADVLARSSWVISQTVCVDSHQSVVPFSLASQFGLANSKNLQYERENSAVAMYAL